MRQMIRLGKGVIALAFAAALSGARLAGAQSEPALAPPPPAPQPPPAPTVPADRDLFAEGSAPAPAPEQRDRPDGPRAGQRRNLIWDRAAQQRLDADRRRLEADLQRLQAERQRIEAELRRAQEQMRQSQDEMRRSQEEMGRAQREASRSQRRGPVNPPPAPGAMNPPQAPGLPTPPGFSPGFGPGPMNANRNASPQGNSDWERELLRAHGFGGDAGGPGWSSATYLGVSPSPTPESLRRHLSLPPGVGLAVSSVEPNSPAQQAGVRPNDILHKLDDQLLVNGEQLAVLVRMCKPGQHVRLSIIRGGKPTQVNVKLDERNLPPLSELGPQPAPTPAPRLYGQPPVQPARPQPPQLRLAPVPPMAPQPMAPMRLSPVKAVPRVEVRVAPVAPPPAQQ